MTNQQFELRSESAEDEDHIQSMAERAFGPGRFARTAHRIREQGTCVEALSLCAWAGDQLAGSIRFSEITVGGRKGALLLGPLMVEEQWAGQGCGLMLICAGLERAREEGYALVILVGDLPYYERAGFSRIEPGHIELPGPCDPARLLGVELQPGAFEEFSGMVAAV